MLVPLEFRVIRDISRFGFRWSKFGLFHVTYALFVLFIMHSFPLCLVPEEEDEEMEPIFPLPSFAPDQYAGFFVFGFLPFCVFVGYGCVVLFTPLSLLRAWDGWRFMLSIGPHYPAKVQEQD